MISLIEIVFIISCHRYLEFFHAVPVANFDVAEMRRKLGFVRIPDLDCEEDVQIRLNTYQYALNQLEGFFTENDNGVGILVALPPSSFDDICNKIKDIHHRRHIKYD